MGDCSIGGQFRSASTHQGHHRRTGSGEGRTEDASLTSGQGPPNPDQPNPFAAVQGMSSATGVQAYDRSKSFVDAGQLSVTA